MKALTKMNRVGYALGDVGNTLTFGMTSAFLLLYYTDVLGISAAAAGTLFLVARIWDGINDPMMGAFCDKMFSKRHGEKFRPFLIKGSWPVVLCAILVFWAPAGLSDIQKLIWAYATYILWGMAYTFVNIPYGSLATVMTNDPQERASLAGARSVGGLVGGIIPAIIMPLFLSLFADEMSKAYLYAITIMGILSFISYLLAYRFTAEHITHEPPAQANAVSLPATIKTIRNNKPYLCVALASMFLLTAMLGQQSILYYYLAENLSGSVWLITANSLIMMVSIAVCAPLAGKLVAQFGVKPIMLNCFALAVVVNLIAFLLPSNIYITLGYLILHSPCILLPSILFWANIADCIDHNYELSGVRNEGVLYSSYSFMRKMGQAIAGFIAGMGLNIVGYTAGLGSQTMTTLMGIKGVMFLLPGFCMLACFFLYQTMWTLPDKTIKGGQTLPQA